MRLAAYAMNTRFELALYGEDRHRLRAAGEQAIEEILRIEKQLNRFDPQSDVSYINSNAWCEEVKVEAGLFDLLEQARRINKLTDGAFDISVTPLMRAWGLSDGRNGKVPSDSELQQAKDISGMHLVRLDSANQTVSFEKNGVELDLGAIGKGYAIERAVDILRECGVDSALIHGGTSTIYAIGSRPDMSMWKVLVSNSDDYIKTIELKDSSLSVSSQSGKFFLHDDIKYGHIIDPKSGIPVNHTHLAYAIGPSPILTDALSTALLVMNKSLCADMHETASPLQRCGLLAWGTFVNHRNGLFRTMDNTSAMPKC